MIYLDACALVKFIKAEKETEALRTWRQGLAEGTELIASELVRLEIARALLRAGADRTRVLHHVGQAVKGVYLVDLTSTVLARAGGYPTPKLGSLDAIHLASAEPFRDELTGFVTYDAELASAADGLGLPVTAPS